MTTPFLFKIILVLAVFSPFALQAAPLNPTPIFFISGGYATCTGNETPADGRVAAYGKAIVNGLGYDFNQAAVITSCFGVDRGSAGFQDVWYRYTGQQPRKMTVKNYLDTMAQWLALPANKDRPLVLYGQSHGGWLTISLVLKLKSLLGPKGVLPPIFLQTVDAIDYMGCQPKQNAAITEAVLHGHPFTSPCSQAPNLQTYNMLPVDAFHQWNNYYQNRCAFLHSGQLAGARNQLSIPPSNIIQESHAGLDAILGEQYPELAFVSADFKSALMTRMVQNRPELDFTMHSVLPFYILPTIRGRLAAWHEAVRQRTALP